jgi:hypothetical protein
MRCAIPAHERDQQQRFLAARESRGSLVEVPASTELRLSGTETVNPNLGTEPLVGSALKIPSCIEGRRVGQYRLPGIIQSCFVDAQGTNGKARTNLWTMPAEDAYIAGQNWLYHRSECSRDWAQASGG